jgi:uncharacterized protein (TIGR03435 family)
MAAAAVLAFAQSPAKPSFEVASVKPSTAENRRPTLPSLQGGRFSAHNLPHRLLIIMAYGVEPYQITGGPEWMNTERFDIDAKAEKAGATEAETRLMLQSLLEERFGLQVKHEKKDGSVYALVTTKGGPKMKPSPDQTPLPPVESTGLIGLGRPFGGPGGPGFGPGGPPPDGAAPGGNGAPGFAERGARGDARSRAPQRGTFRMRGGSLVGNAVPVANLLPLLSQMLAKPVIDKTGLTQLYDFEMRFQPPDTARGGAGGLRGGPGGPGGPGGFAGRGGRGGGGFGGGAGAGIAGGGNAGAFGAGPGGPSGQSGPQDDPRRNADAPTLFSALQDQLGLKLESATGPVESVVIEKVERPSEN